MLSLGTAISWRTVCCYNAEFLSGESGDKEERSITGHCKCDSLSEGKQETEKERCSR